ncbi:MAG: TerB family tellurite resistance protein [Prevotella sp.]
MGYGKWIGGLWGFASGGALGALAGFILGAAYDMIVKGLSSDENSRERISYDNFSENQTADRASESRSRDNFLFVLMVLSAHVIKADGKVMHSEMECMRRFLRMNFGVQAVAEGEAIILKLFERRKQIGEYAWEHTIDECCREIAATMTEEVRLQLIHYLVELAKADGSLPAVELDCLHRVAERLRLSADVVDQMTGLGGNNLEDAYKVLGISSSATDDEVKKAFRRMALKHHPDKVATLGEDVRKAAEQKFKDINAAKDIIYKARGL